ncbi:hypothetical protein FY557_13920 [Chryseobacterium sp. SN22]|uniref:hypothetical protein n=1 Tax=Chryseobacterium sp. SN22 TaxID=2606431 RepID=UPI0011ECFA9B|nr:hypothetical protein [Chryseobacterium sp. SN22]KAA0127264.1 hypothetical protein FY557_13920 [Chryseobacterium sp. SN22]
MVLYGTSEDDEMKANSITGNTKAISAAASDLTRAKAIFHQVEVAVAQAGLMTVPFLKTHALFSCRLWHQASAESRSWYCRILCFPVDSTQQKIYKGQSA